VLNITGELKYKVLKTFRETSHLKQDSIKLVENSKEKTVANRT
jgi:hypothetical protein